jgi:hypothetical protein
MAAAVGADDAPGALDRAFGKLDARAASATPKKRKT